MMMFICIVLLVGWFVVVFVVCVVIVFQIVFEVLFVIVDMVLVVVEVDFFVIYKVEFVGLVVFVLLLDMVVVLEFVMVDYVCDGCVYGIYIWFVQKGEIVSDYFVGVWVLESGVLIEDDMIYCIYLMIKLIIGVVMMMLWEDGKFDFDDLVIKYVLEFVDLNVLVGVNEDGMLKLVVMECVLIMCELMSYMLGFVYGFGGDDLVNLVYCDL